MTLVSDGIDKNCYVFTYEQLLKYYRSCLSCSNDLYSVWKPQLLVFFQQIGELQNETLNS